MVKIESLVGGIFPKSDELRLLIGRWERNLIKTDELESHIIRETDKFDKIAEGIIHTEPLYNWYDIFRPVASLFDGVNIGPLTRFEETNTFYRIPEFSDSYEIKKSPLDFSDIKDNLPFPLFKGSEKSVLFIPGPLTMTKFSRIPLKMKEEEFTESIARNYALLLDYYEDDREIFLMERVPLCDNYSKIISKYIDTGRIYLFTSGDLKDENFSDKTIKFKAIITNLNEHNIEIAEKFSTVLGIKIIDAHNTKVENEIYIANIIKNLSLNKVIISPNDYLDFLPRKIAERKIELMYKIGE